MTERYFTDGTEPTVLPHLRVCRGVSCNQGRQPCAHPDLCTLPAEASTEVGGDEPAASQLERLLVILVVLVSAAAVIGFVGGLLS